MQAQALRSITEFPKLRQTGIHLLLSRDKHETDKPRVKYCLLGVCFVNSTGLGISERTCVRCYSRPRLNVGCSRLPNSSIVVSSRRHTYAVPGSNTEECVSLMATYLCQRLTFLIVVHAQVFKLGHHLKRRFRQTNGFRELVNLCDRRITEKLCAGSNVHDPVRV